MIMDCDVESGQEGLSCHRVSLDVNYLLPQYTLCLPDPSCLNYNTIGNFKYCVSIALSVGVSDRHSR